MAGMQAGRQLAIYPSSKPQRTEQGNGKTEMGQEENLEDDERGRIIRTATSTSRRQTNIIVRTHSLFLLS